MPELPEVETIKRGLSRKILHKKIIKVEVRKAKLVKNPLIVFIKTLTDSSFEKIQRCGKLLILKLNNKHYLLVHLKMTGQLVYQNHGQIVAGGHPFPDINKLPNKFSHIIFTFKDESRLFFNDQRQFGYMKIVNQNELNQVLSKYGIDPLTKEFNLINFLKTIEKRAITLKPYLMNQTIIAGIGNIYADEICFAAGVKPQRKINRLILMEKKRIYIAINQVLTKAIDKGGTTFNNYRNADGKKGNFSAFLMVYRRTGEKCLRCRKGTIQRITLGQRGTHFCPECQK